MFDVQPDRRIGILRQFTQVGPQPAAVDEPPSMQPLARRCANDPQAALLPGAPDVRWLAALGGFVQLMLVHLHTAQSYHKTVFRRLVCAPCEWPWCRTFAAGT